MGPPAGCDHPADPWAVPRSRTDTAQPTIAHTAVLFDGNGLRDQLTCAHTDVKHRCDQPLINGKSLIGARIRATGLLVIDCDNYGAARGCSNAGRQLELHPVFALTQTGTCTK